MRDSITLTIVGPKDEEFGLKRLTLQDLATVFEKAGYKVQFAAAIDARSNHVLVLDKEPAHVESSDCRP